jgi:hypothetical protein
VCRSLFLGCHLTFIRLVRTSFWLLDKGEGFAEVGREWVLGGEGVATRADLNGAVPAGGADEFPDRPADAVLD